MLTDKSEKYKHLSSEGAWDDLSCKDLGYLIQAFVSHFDRALDYGCGAGRLTGFLRQGGFEHIVSMDQDAGMLQEAQHAGLSNEYHLIKGQPPAGFEAFDFILCSLVVMEVESLEALTALLANLKALLRDESSRLLVIANNDYMYDRDWPTQCLETQFPENLNLRQCGKVRIRLTDIDLIIDDYYYEEAEYERAMTQAGLEIDAKHFPVEGPPSLCLQKNDTSPYVFYLLKKAL